MKIKKRNFSAQSLFQILALICLTFLTHQLNTVFAQTTKSPNGIKSKSQKPKCSKGIKINANGFSRSFKLIQYFTNAPGIEIGEFPSTLNPNPNPCLSLQTGNYEINNLEGLKGFTFSVTPSNEIANINNDAAAMGEGTNTLTLKTATISIDTGDYIGSYKFLGKKDRYGPDKFILIKGLYYSINLVGDTFYFVFDANEEVTDIGNKNAITGSKNLLKFNNVPVTINVQNYKGGYKFFSHKDYAYGNKTFYLIPGLKEYYLQINKASSNISFSLGTDQTPVIKSPQKAGCGRLNEIIFNNIWITIKPQDSTKRYFVNGGTYKGMRDLILIPDLEYPVTVEGGGNESIKLMPTSTSTITPTSGILQSGGTDYNFDFSPC